MGFYCQPWSKAAVAAAALDVSLFQTETTSTAAAASLRDMLDKANLNWDNYLGSPIGMTSSFVDNQKATKKFYNTAT